MGNIVPPTDSRSQIPFPSPADSDEPARGLAKDAMRFLKGSNEERLEALLELLRELELNFDLEEVANPRRTRDPRPNGQNVLVSLGTGSEEIVVGAHFDAAYLPDGSLSPGMVDNAAAAVILAQVAHSLRDQAFRRCIRFVWFDLEEAGMRGSQCFLGARPARPVRAMINLDNVAYGDTLIYGPAGSDDELPSLVREACATHSVGCIDFPRFPAGDERPFVSAGIPAISLALVRKLDAHQMWLLLNGGLHSGLEVGFTPEILRTIHSPHDVPARLEPDAMAKVSSIVISVLQWLDSRAGRLPPGSVHEVPRPVIAAER